MPIVADLDLAQLQRERRGAPVSRQERRNILEHADYAVYRLFRAKVAAEPFLGQLGRVDLTQAIFV
jgi:hypothetical protein